VGSNASPDAVRLLLVPHHKWRQTGLAEVRRILNDFVAFAVALVILIRRGIRRFINGSAPLISTSGHYRRQAVAARPFSVEHHHLNMPPAALLLCRSPAIAYALRTPYTLFDNIFLWVWIDITIPNPAINTIRAEPRNSPAATVRPPPANTTHHTNIYEDINE
jgi:hypothetical protein